MLFVRNRNRQNPPDSGPISAPVVDTGPPIDQGEPGSSLPTDGQVDEPPVNEPSDQPSDNAREQAVELTQQGREAMRAGNTEEAIKLFEQAMATDPHFLPAYFNLSDLYRQNDLPRKSIGALEAAVEHNPDEAVAWARLGESMLFTAEEPEAALNAFQEASALEPDMSQPYAGQALSLLMLDEEEAAKEAIEQALLLDPNSYEARLANAVYLGKQGKRLPALRELRQLVSDRNSPILVKERARQLIDLLQQ
jgi:tetratricopeptide (TPR) repeat protein